MYMYIVYIDITYMYTENIRAFRCAMHYITSAKVDTSMLPILVCMAIYLLHVYPFTYIWRGCQWSYREWLVMVSEATQGKLWES